MPERKNSTDQLFLQETQLPNIYNSAKKKKTVDMTRANFHQILRQTLQKQKNNTFETALPKPLPSPDDSVPIKQPPSHNSYFYESYADVLPQRQKKTLLPVKYHQRDTKHVEDMSKKIQSQKKYLLNKKYFSSTRQERNPRSSAQNQTRVGLPGNEVNSL